MSLSVCLSAAKCILAKRLIGSGCRLGWVGQGMGVLDGGGDRRREGAVLGLNLGRPIVTNEAFVA